jgi:hypothetical protein
VLEAVYAQGADFFLPLDWQFLASGVGLLLILLVFPSGLGGIIADVRDGALRWVARRRKLVVPSLVADVRVEDDLLSMVPQDTIEPAPVADGGASTTGAGAGDAAEQREGVTR